MESLLYAADTYAVVQPHLASMRAAGFTVIKNGYYPANDSNLANNLAWMDACHAAGLKVMVHLCHWVNPAAAGYNLATAVAFAEAVKDHPACYGWYCDDESNGTDYPIADRLATYQALKAVSDNPIMEVHFRVDPVPIEGGGFYDAHYPTDGTIVHDIYGIDYYLYEVYNGNTTSWQNYINGEYAKLTTTDKASLTHVMQCFGSTLAKVPPDDNIQNVQYPRTISPNHWQTWGVSYFTFAKFTEPTWILPYETGGEHLLDDMAAANAAYLPTAAVTVGLILSGSNSTHTIGGTCAAGCIVIIDGTTWATTDAAGTSWTAVVSPGSHTVVASNGLETATVTFDTGPTIPASAITGAADTALRVYDGAVKYIPLVDPAAGNASPTRIYDGVAVYALSSAASGGTKNQSTFGFGLGFGF